MKTQLQRSGENPILRPEGEGWEARCVLNPAVIYSKEEACFVMLYRAAGNDKRHTIRLGLAKSRDGIRFRRCGPDPVFDVDPQSPDGGCVEDPRLVRLGDAYFMTYAARAYAPGQYWLDENNLRPKYVESGEVEAEEAPFYAKTNITVSYLAMTKDFRQYKRLGRITDSRIDDRDVMLFPEKINGKFVRLSRPKFPPTEKIRMPSIWIATSSDILEYSEANPLLTGREWWEQARLGACCPPIRSRLGWVLFYHGVCKRGIYRIGAALLDLSDPARVLARTKDFLMRPERDYETRGIYDGCVFPTAGVVKDGLLYLYYGCADTCIGVATCRFAEFAEELYRCHNVSKESI